MTEKKTFTEEQMEHYRRAFRIYDMNKDGKIEASELQALATYLGYRINEKQTFQIIRKLNLDESGVITFNDFLRAMPGNTEMISEEDHRKAVYRQKFQEHDHGNQGFVTSSAAEKILRTELKVSDEQLDSLIKHFHLRDKDQMNYDDFVEFYCRVQESKEEIKKSFQEFDADNKGFVSFEDAQRIMGNYGFSDSEIMTLFNRHDRNKDNLLNYEEFISFWGVPVKQ